MSIEAMKQALEALYMANTREWPENKIGAAINALSAAIAESAMQRVTDVQQEIELGAPKEGDRVICIEDDSAGTVEFTSSAGGPYIKFDDGSYGQWSLCRFGELFRYAHPPRREWVGLTDDEIFKCVGLEKLDALRYLEAKLKEKNQWTS